VEVVDQFNHQVEADMVFIYKFIIFHLICRCIRWHHTIQVYSKQATEMVRAIDSWITLYGPMKELIVDGERGITTAEETTSYLKRKGVKLVIRAPQQHARVIERRGALLRDSIHRTDEQLKIEGIANIPFSERLSECTLAGNCLLSINNASPYQALYGRMPNILPGIEILNSDGDIVPLTNRQVGRVREIAVQQIVEGTAQQKLIRAINTRTLPSGQAQQLKAGDEVEFYRPGGTKDVSGWHGPATVVDVSQAGQGTLVIKHQQGEMTCRYGDVRRALEFLVFLSANLDSGLPGHTITTAWHYLKHFVEAVSVGTCLHLGWIFNRKYSLTSATSKHAKLFDACRYFASNGIYRDEPISFKLGKGCGSLPAYKPCDASVLMWWTEQSAVRNLIELECSSGGAPPIDMRNISPNNWQSVRFFQSCDVVDFVGAEDLDSNQSKDPLPSEENVPFRQANEGLLTPIPEGSEGGTDSSGFFFFQNDPELAAILHAATQYEDWSEPIPMIEDKFLPQETVSDYEEGHQGSYFAPELIENYHVMCANQRADLPLAHDLEPEVEFVEVFYEDSSWKLLTDVPRPPKEDEVVVLQINLKDQVKRAVVIRDDASLTPEEIKTHAKEVEAAQLSELKTWAKFKCFSRKSRHSARNIIDCKWVLKWKWEHAASDSTKGTDATAARRVIRARLTVRGFKDIEKNLIDRYAGTSQRYSQRIICSESVVQGWDMATTDIAKAFLQGVTYEELHELTGEPMREVNFYLPPAAIPLLQQVDGFSNFNPSTEVLHCDKPGTGSVDAPRCFSMKLALVTKNKCGMVPSSVDAELCTLHVTDPVTKKPRLVCLMTKHVDDLKLTGEKEVINHILTEIQKVFGPLKIIWNNFTNCGVRHSLTTTGERELSLDQIEYASNLRPIVHEELKAKNSEELCGTELHNLYRSLLGAVAFLYLTRADVLVFISACQRWGHAPKVIHVKRLNVICRWIQRNPKKLVYRKFSAMLSHLKMVSDAAFKKEDDDCHALRGCAYLRAPGADDASFTKGGVVHLIEFLSKTIRHVTRSTFSSELHAGCDSADLGVLIGLIMHEIQVGPVSATEARSLRLHGGYAVKLVLYVDAMSVYAAVTATNIKAPAEKSLLSHVQFLREMLEHKLLAALVWLDTRDMLADGLTKGTVERDVLQAAMAGLLHLRHENKVWIPKRTGNAIAVPLAQDIAD